jgi:hypothetical protein
MWAKVSNNTIEYITNRRDPLDTANGKISWNTFLILPPEEKLALGFLPVHTANQPNTLYYTFTSTYEVKDGYVQEILITQERELSAIKTQLKQQVTNLRDNKINGGYTHNLHTYQTDLDSRLNIAGAVTLAQILNINFPSDFTWRDVDNNDVPMTATEVIQFGAAVGGFVNQIHQASKTHKNAIDAITTHNELLNYDINTGW